MSKVTAPFTDEQVKSLNLYQVSGVFHEFTCGDCGNPLLATNEGWRCLILGCTYTQDWAHSWMADGSWENGLRENLNASDDNA